MKKELTQRQREALLAIHDLTVRNGISPTIREIGIALDVSSDQTVIEMLERLEKRSLLVRDKKQARGTSLTDKAKFILGIVGTESSTTNTNSPLILNDQQQKVFKQLSEIDPRLGHMYKGALFTLRTPNNEDYIPQSAHSMREIIDHLSHKGEIPTEMRDKIKNDRGTRATVHGLRFFFDPQASITSENNPYQHLYNEYQTRLQDIAHHNESIEEEAYKNLIDGMEYFLLRYVFPSQIDTYQVLDEIIKHGPTGIDSNDLLMLVKKNAESYRFFFKHADSQWLGFLEENKFLDSTWEVGDYLSRTASEKPEQTLKIFLAISIPENAGQAKTSFAVAVSKLPSHFAVDGVKKIIDENWIKDTRGNLLLYKMQDILKNILEGKEYASGLLLVDSLLDVFPEEYGSYGSHRTGAYVSEFEYSQIIACIGTIPVEYIQPFLKLLICKLIKSISTVHVTKESKTEDYSYIWRSAIEGHEQNHSYERIEDSIISGIRDLFEKYITYLTSSGRVEEAIKETEDLLKNIPQYSILSRIKLYVFRIFPEVFKKEIDKVVSKPILKSSVWHEYSLLANTTFSTLKLTSKEKYFSTIDKQNKADDKFIDSWRVRLISIIQNDLTAIQRKKYAFLLKQAKKLDQPYFTSYHHEAFVGPTSPKNESDLENKDVSEVIDFLKSWNPNDEFFGPSRSGLGMSFRNIVAKESAKYSKDAVMFLDKELRPIYIYNFISGLIEASKQKNVLDWDKTLELIIEIMARARRDELQIFAQEKRDRLESDWEDVLQEISRLIVHGLDTNGISFRDKDRVWTILKYLSEHKDPTPEHEEKYGGDNSDPYTMSINTVRGEIFHAIFAYIFWYNRAEKSSEKIWTPSVPQEAKEVLELHLNPAHDPALSIRSVYGRFFPWLLSYGGDWAKALIEKIFPLEYKDLRYASWETYLSNMVFEESYKLLRPQYELAVRDIKEGKVPKRKYWADVVERLAQHAMTAYAFEIDDKENPFYDYFFSNVSGKCKGMAVSMGGRYFVSREGIPQGERIPKTEVLQNFWDWRLKESNAPSELREFGWWTKLGKFENKWLLEHLLQTVEKTKGDINGEFFVMDTLKALAGEYPLLSAKILKFIFASSDRRNGYAFLHMEELKDTLLKIIRSNDEEAKKVVHEIIDFLLKLGFEDLRTLIDTA